MNHSAFVRGLIICALFLTSASCSDSNGPGVPHGEYRLVSVDGVALPAPAPGYGLNYFYTEGQLVLGISGGNTWFAHHKAARSPTIFFDEYFPGGTYRLEGSTITFVQQAISSYPSLTLTGSYQTGVIAITRNSRVWRYEL
jgi:hypothetical protein